MEGTLAAGAIRALGTYQGFLQCEDSPYIKENLLKPESKHSKMESTEEEGKRSRASAAKATEPGNLRK